MQYIGKIKSRPAAAGKDIYMDPQLIKNISDFIPSSSKELLLNPIFNSLGNGISSAIDTIFYPLIKRNIIHKQELEDLQKKTAENISNIPPDNLDTTKPGLFLKALEESKYSINEEILRDMFAKLIASGVDNRKNQSITPRYATVLSQLGSQDAQFLSLLHKQLNFQVPTGYLFIENTITSEEHSISDTFLCNNDGEIFKLPMDTIAILTSLGIISSTHESYLTYDLYKKGYHLIESHFNALNIITPSENEKIALKKGIINTTSFGQNLFHYIF